MMRRHILAAAAVLLASACNSNVNFGGGGTPIQLSGVNGQRAFTPGSFDRIELSGPFEMVVTVGGETSVRAEGDTALLEKLDVRVDGNRLLVGIQSGHSYSSQGGRTTIQVTTPRLAGADIAGSGSIRVGAFQTDRFEGEIAGSGALLMEGVQLGELVLDIAGSGDVQATGTAGSVRVNIAGSGNARLDGLQAERAEVEVAGSGNANVRATGTARVRVLGSGNIVVQGGARCDVEKMGSGNVSCG